MDTIPVRGRKRTNDFHQLMKVGTIPVRGRKPVVAHREAERLCTIPVRGRKQARNRPQAMPLCTIPVRGRKLNRRALVYSGRQYHPRKGAKTAQIVFLLRVDLHCNFSPQNPLRRCAPAPSKGGSFCSCRYPVLSSPFWGSWHGVSRD